MKPHVRIRSLRFQKVPLNPDELWFSIRWNGGVQVDLPEYLSVSKIDVKRFRPGSAKAGARNATGWISATTTAAQTAAHDALLYFGVMTRASRVVVQFMNVTVEACYLAAPTLPEEV